MNDQHTNASRCLAGAASAMLGAALAVAAAVAGCSGASDTGQTGNGDAGVEGIDASGATHPVSTPDASTAGDGASSNDGASAPIGPDATIDEAGPGAGDASEASPSSDGATFDASEADVGPTGLGFDCSPSAGGAIGTSGAPAALACTGFYASWPTRTIAADALPFDPSIHLWSDGATKARWIRLPPGTQIDTTDMDEWTFPVGTKIWKEFTVGGKKVETRFLFKRGASDWVWTTYQWSADQSAAPELTAGATNVNGTGYEIPDLENCRVCHMGRLDFVLGFEAIGLSTPQATGLTMSALVARGWLTKPPAAPLAIPGNATESAALGWLHANCGTSCHNPSTYSLAGSSGFSMRLSASKLASVQATDTWTTGVNVQATFSPPDGTVLKRIAPKDPAHSCVTYRGGRRDTQGEGIQMPPNDTHVVDTAGMQLVTSWIDGM